MTLKIALAQTNFLVGNITANVNNIIKAAIYARDELSADIIVFPELTITGYPAEDLLLRADFIAAANNAVYQLAEQVTGIALVVGFPEFDGDKLYNSAVVLHQGVMLARYRKQALPNYGVFDEQRYFAAGNQTCVFEFNGIFIGLTICEDVWKSGIIDAEELSPFAVSARYPGEDEEVSKQEAVRALTVAEQVRKAVRAVLGKKS